MKPEVAKAFQLWLLAKQWQAKKARAEAYRIEKCNREKEEKTVQAIKLCPEAFMIWDDGRHNGMVAVYLNVAWLQQQGMNVALKEQQASNLHIRREIGLRLTSA